MNARRLAGAAVALFLALAVAPTAAPASTQDDPGVHRAPDSIAHDCSVDVTSEFDAWIGSVPDASTLELALGGCYRIDGSVTVRDRSGLVFEGNGATLRAGTDGNQSRRHLRFSGGTDLVVRDLTIRGALPNTQRGPERYREDRAFQHGIELRGVAGATLEHVRVVDVYGDFVYVGRGPGGAWSTDVTVTRSRFVGSGRQGISVTAGERIAVTDNVVRGVALTVFDLEPNTGQEGVREVRITGNTTGGAGSFFLAILGAGPVADVTVEDNVMRTTTSGLVWAVAPEGETVGPLTIRRNRFRVDDALYAEHPAGAFYLARCAGVTIAANRATFPRTLRVTAVEVRDCTDVVVEGNTFEHAGELLVDETDASGS